MTFSTPLVLGTDLNGKLKESQQIHFTILHRLEIHGKKVQIDTKWTDEIKKVFLKWLDDNEDELPMVLEELNEYIKNRTW